MLWRSGLGFIGTLVVKGPIPKSGIGRTGVANLLTLMAELLLLFFDASSLPFSFSKRCSLSAGVSFWYAVGRVSTCGGPVSDEPNRLLR